VDNWDRSSDATRGASVPGPGSVAPTDDGRTIGRPAEGAGVQVSDPGGSAPDIVASTFRQRYGRSLACTPDLHH
jgi:hypothetical protein